MSVEQMLQDTFKRYAEQTPAPTRAPSFVLTQHRRSQRRRLGAGAVALSLAVGTAIPATVALLEQPPGPALAAQPSPEYVPQPPRGSLAGDDAFLAAIAATAWPRAPEDAPVVITEEHVAFAGDVSAGRWVRLVARVDSRWMGLWLSGPPGAGAGELQPMGEPDVVTNGWQAFVGGTGTDLALVVLTDPGDVVEVSGRPEVGADGVVGRAYHVVPVADGVATEAITGLTLRSVDVRVSSNGVAKAVGSETGAWFADDGTPVTQLDTWEDVDLTSVVAGARGAVDASVLRAALHSVTDALALPSSDVSVSAIWGGSAGLDGDIDANAFLAALRLPSGAQLLFGGWAQQPGDGEFAGMTGESLLELFPANAALPTLIAMRCDVQPDSSSATTQSRLVVVAPVNAATVKVLAGDDVLTETSLVAGTATTGFPTGADRVVAVDRAGHVLADEAIGGRVDLTSGQRPEAPR